MKKMFVQNLSCIVFFNLMPVLSATCVLLLISFVSISLAVENTFEGIKINALMEGHPTQQVVAKLLPEFEQQTGIMVNIEVLPYEMLTKKSKETLSHKSSKYDVYFDGWINAIEWATDGHLEPLTEYIDNSVPGNNTGQYIDLNDFVEAYISDAKIGNTLYGLPMYGESTFLYYRKDLFDEYHIKVPETMEELMDAAEQIKKNTKNQVYGITLRGREGIHSVYIWASFLWGFGGHWIDDQGKADLFTPEAIAATQFYSDLLNKFAPPAHSQFGWIENRDIFIRGKAAMSIDATVNGAFNEDPGRSRVAGKVGYTLVPKKAGVTLKGGHTSLVTHQMYINRYSNNKRAAFLFIAWATSKQVQLKGLEIAPNCGVSSKTALNSEIYKKKFGPFRESMLEALKHGNPDYIPTLKEGPFMFEKTGKILSQVVAGKRTASNAMKELNLKINKYLLQ